MAVNVIKRSWKVDRLVRPETLNGMTFQAESGGHRFEITGYDANGSMIAFGGTVTAVFLRPDNTDVALTGAISNGIAQVTLTEECYQVPGRFGLAVFVNQNNTKTVVYDCIGTVARTSSGVVAQGVVEDVSTLIDRIEAAVNSIPQDYSALSKAVGNITCPELRNGSTGNPWNTDSVTTKYIIKLDKTCDDLILEYIGNTSAAQYVFGYSIFKGVADGTESYEARSTAQSYADFPEQYVQTEPYVIIPMSQFGDYTHIAIVLWARSDETTYIPLRIATEQYNLRVTFRHASYMGHEDINNRSVKVGVLNAAKMASPLKLVHFSDLHKDINALNRIKASAEFVCPNADNIICTGDMVANTYAEITSWWPPEIMTVIGNHDTASWDGSAYDWTALSMAQRDEMYISPFKAYWGITHTAGTSYYYKDYPTANIRLIVLDAMLYSGTPGAEATAQTEWLAGLLSSAISNNLHVLIAIHAPHGGSVPVACSFTKLGQETMYVNVDCNTPDVVINTVATSIGNGLHFIGYICGHTHQDAVWDCTGDRSQFMYTVTCAAVDQTAQWINSDQYRTDEQDAFNVLTIDTASTTIKILRGGGANTDVALRPRVSLVIDYSTGKIITDTYASGTQGAVVYGEAQTLTDAEKAQARTNIGAGSAADVSENTADITANANEITSLKSAFNEEINGTNGLYYMGKPFVISSSNKWTQSSQSHISIPVSAGDTINILQNTEYPGVYAFLKSDNAASGVAADFATGETGRYVLSEGESSGDKIVPSDCTILYLTSNGLNNSRNLPEKIVINGVDIAYNIRKKIDKIASDAESLAGDIVDMQGAIDTIEIKQEAIEIKQEAIPHKAWKKNLDIWGMRGEYGRMFSPVDFSSVSFLAGFDLPVFFDGYKIVHSVDLSKYKNVSASTFTVSTQAELETAVSEAVSGDTIIINDGVYTPITLTKSINLIGNGKPVFVTDDAVAFDAASADNVFRTTNTFTDAITDVYDASRIDEGIIIPMTKMQGTTGVARTPGSWVLSSSKIYVHLFDGRVATNRNVILCDKTKIPIKCIEPAENATIYMENITVVGGDSNLLYNDYGSYNTQKLIAKGCRFYFGRTHNNVSLYGVNGFFQNCEASFSHKDGFNYHKNVNSEYPGGSGPNTGTVANGFEIDCIGHDNGYDDTAASPSDNGSTMHNGGTAVRINGVYYHNKGGNVADTSANTVTHNYCCYAFDSIAPQDTNCADFWADNKSTMNLYGCRASGNSQYNLWIDRGATINANDCEYETAYGMSVIDENTRRINALSITDTASGPVASFPDGADGIPLKSCVVGIEPVQEGTGDPSPDNVRPISGWTGATVQKCGANLFDASTVGTQNRYINKNTGNSGVPTTEAAEWRCTDYIRVAPGMKLYFGQINITAGAAGMAFYDSSKVYISGVSSTELANSGNVVTVPDGAAFLRHSFRIDEGYNTDWEHTVYICLDSAPHEWTPYTGASLPISWEAEAGTVYGGSLDVTSGVLTVDRLFWEIGPNDITKITVASTGLYVTNVPKPENVPSSSIIVSNQYKPSNNANVDFSIRSVSSIYIYDSRFTDLETAKALIGSTPVQCLAPLATPITYQLSPHEILSLLGQNHVWADTGDTSVIYRADPKMYIQRLTGEAEDDMVANANIPSGKYFSVGNKLFLSTSAIAAGETITPGTNCTPTDLASALNALLAQ